MAVNIQLHTCTLSTAAEWKRSALVVGHGESYAGDEASIACLEISKIKVQKRVEISIEMSVCLIKVPIL